MTATCENDACDQNGIAKDASGIGGLTTTGDTILCGGCGKPCTVTNQ